MFADRTKWNLEANRLAQALARLRASATPVLDLTASNPTECGFHHDAQAILSALSNPAALRYDPDPRGLASARRAVASYYSARSLHLSIDDIFLTTGTSEAYSFVFRLLCNPRDEILIPAPGYPLFDLLADLLDVKLVRYPLLYDHGWQIDFHSLERALTPCSRAIVVVHPNNPTGHFATANEFSKLNEICSARGLALIADEVFLDFALDGPARPTFAACSSALAFTLSGISKISGLPQMKAAWIVAGGPEARKKDALARLEIIADSYLSMNAPVQLALPAFLELRKNFQQQLLARVRKNLAALDRQLSAQKICSRLDVEGGWYVVLSVPAARSDEDLAVELLEQKHVHVHPGHFYDFSTAGFLVASLITPEDIFQEGIHRLLATF
ncbi:MAG TPA: pyridoxal phosphate-dependent aminotransferase [Candidatus Limnocylindrales bacterium]|nr:pyridoxal phosphate-dependent aminotransferase [Candidatus Limnocylindrales bacterium]